LLYVAPERQIGKTDAEGIWARWHFGKALLAGQAGKKQLPNGRLNKVAAAVRAIWIARSLNFTTRPSGYSSYSIAT
jgi:hypothetical protein